VRNDPGRRLDVARWQRVAVDDKPGSVGWRRSWLGGGKGLAGRQTSLGWYWRYLTFRQMDGGWPVVRRGLLHAADRKSSIRARRKGEPGLVGDPCDWTAISECCRLLYVGQARRARGKKELDRAAVQMRAGCAQAHVSSPADRRVASRAETVSWRDGRRAPGKQPETVGEERLKRQAGGGGLVWQTWQGRARPC
jgi:hypothetical protein